MTSFATLLADIAVIAFLVWGGVLTLVCIARDGTWNPRLWS